MPAHVHTVSAMVIAISLISAFLALVASGWLSQVGPAQREPSVVPITYRPGSAPPIPRVGGAAVFGAVVSALVIGALFGLPGVEMVLHRIQLFGGIFAGATLLLAIGLADDFLDLSPAVKLLAQVFAAMLAVSGGLALRVISLGHGSTVTLGWMGIPLVLFWIVAVTNAFNFIDGLDGLAPSVGIIGFGTIAVSAAILGRSDVLLVSAILIGALLGFLRYNFAPARIYLGDGGSLLIGYLLATLSLEGATSPATGSLVYVPVFALALPLIDAGVAVVRRWLRHMPVWKGDHRHIHHRVLAMGLSKHETVAALTMAAGVFAGGGLLVLRANSSVFGPALAAAFGGMVLLVIVGLRSLDYYEFTAVRTALHIRPESWREFVREEIRIRDAERELATASNFDDLRTTLDRCALAFGLDRIEISRQRPRLRRSWHGEHVDVPASDTDAGSSNGWLLRVWHGEYESPRPELVNRVARALSRSCGRWLRDFGLLDVPLWANAVAFRHVGARPPRLPGHLAKA